VKYPRYRVATCEGWPIDVRTLKAGGGSRPPGLSATVCDTLNCWAAVKTYRSEDRVFRGGRFTTRGRGGAIEDAEAHAAHLNGMHRRALHAERVRVSRAAARREE
jgi:hypothetical protein